MPCSRTQHGLTRVGLESPTSGSGIRGINHQATVLPQGSIVVPCYIQNSVITNCVIKRLMCISRAIEQLQFHYVRCGEVK